MFHRCIEALFATVNRIGLRSPCLALILLLPVERSWCSNGILPPVQSPSDDLQTVLKRLSEDSGGKTPTVKQFSKDWIQSLVLRGEATVYNASNSRDFAFIGMPVSGIGTGELYLGGDGRLWDWDMINMLDPSEIPAYENGDAYRLPLHQGDPKDGRQNVIDQRFVLRTNVGGKIDTRTLDKNGFPGVKFSGEYPIGYVDYADPSCPVQISLEAFSPFVPLSVKDSSYPGTILNYTLTNTSNQPVECVIGGWMENATYWKTRREVKMRFQNKVVRGDGLTLVSCSAIPSAAPGRPPDVSEDFERGTYENWTVEGEAFGSRPVKYGEVLRKNGLNTQQVMVPLEGPSDNHYYADSFLNGSDRAVGKLTSKPFKIERPYILFLIGGGKMSHMGLVIDGKELLTASGPDKEALAAQSWDVSAFIGKTAQIQIVDDGSGPWGHIMVDHILFSDTTARSPLEQRDAGNMSIALLGDPSSAEGIANIANANESPSAEALLAAPASETAQNDGPGPKLIGGLRRKITLKPGEKATASFIVSWYFPNRIGFRLNTPTEREYSVRFKSSANVVEEMARNFKRLAGDTRLWHDAWYDSTLPHWFLERTFANVSILATNTCYLLADGRFYAYEGRYSCAGTCTHVWGYQQALGFLFPEIERGLRERVDFVVGTGMNSQGGIAMRGEYYMNMPVDGQAGCILRTYLAHRMSQDDSFLKENYDSVKKAMNYLIATNDPKRTGILEGGQSNTLDRTWYGEVSWISLYYQAALRATAAMADEMADAGFAGELRSIADLGKTHIETKLFNGEYFYQQGDPAHLKDVGSYDGCEIDQLMGQSWAYQVGLGSIIDTTKANTALDSIWTYNFTTDIAPYKAVFKSGLAYALPDEGGVLLATFPYGLWKEEGGKTVDFKEAFGKSWEANYFNECWTGCEHLLASLMLWQGKVDKALAVVRTIHDRYDGAKRNPWNELECGSHYSRSMASYGVFTAITGFEYDGPRGAIRFAARLTPDDFKAVFTSAEGWGSFAQKRNGKTFEASIHLRYGKLRLNSLTLSLPFTTNLPPVVTLDGKAISAKATVEDGSLVLHFDAPVTLAVGQKLAVNIAQQ